MRWKETRKNHSHFPCFVPFLKCLCFMKVFFLLLENTWIFNEFQRTSSKCAYEHKEFLIFFFLGHTNFVHWKCKTLKDVESPIMPNRKCTKQKLSMVKVQIAKMQPKTTQNRRLQNRAKFYSEGAMADP